MYPSDEELFRRARQAAKKAYCPYSGFAVGAVAVTQGGRIFDGANIENASYGLTLCAERVAVLQAALSGSGQVAAVVVYTPTEMPNASCGACRQVIREFGRSAVVTSICDSHAVLRLSIDDLLPHPFELRQSTIVSQPALSVCAEKTRLKMCIDIDNVIAQTDEVMRRLIAQATWGRVNLAYDDVKCFDYCDCVDANGQAVSREEWNGVHNLFSEADCLSSLVPLPGAQEALNVLSKKYALHFVTSRLPQARSGTVQWLERNGFPAHSLHFVGHRQKHIALSQFDVSVEDDPAQAIAFATSGFGLNLVIAHPWNAEIEQSSRLRRVECWADVLMFVMDS